MTEYKPRSAWTTTSRGGARLTGTKLQGIVWHWPGTSRDVIGVESESATANRLRGYRNYHVNTRGWSDIGYNHAIDQAGRVWDLRGLGRVGAHCASTSNPDANHEWMGVLLILGRSERPSAAMIQACRDFRRDVFLERWPGRDDMTGHGRAPGVPGAQTSCPGPYAAALITDGTLGRSGDTLSWDEDLTPGTPGNDITNLADETLPDNYGRYAADLLGYAAAGGSILLRPEELVDRIFRTDGVLRSPSTYPGRDTNPHWYAETFLRRIWDMLHALRDVPDRLDAIEAAVHGSNADEIKELINRRHDEAAAQRQAQADAAERRDAAILDLLAEHNAGNLDAAAVVDGIRGLLHEATAPQGDSLDGG